ncbi:sugar ABC transporter substrate-binding protein [Paenibacillus sp.]|uniref:ABC transporter substrate-binding protein n=1 Tax=Paenibacillus sp. TaxID=58172 RepID=UPI002D3361BE|nr:sugar ABC transporter substrate-binding protein [Paenibacillus sp.]HZG58520.1 sugar ABC transporter substrate-binding protein [Paenibacillus sp.]
MKSSKVVVSILLVFALLLAACSSGGGGSTASEPPAASSDSKGGDAAQPAPAADSGEKVEIRYAFWGMPEEVAVQEALKKRFEELNPNITVKLDLVSSTGDFFAALLTQIAGGKAPDVFYIGEALVSSLASKDVLLDLMPYAQASGLDFSQYFPANLDPMGYQEGHLWAFPKDTTPYMMYYNKDLFDKAGVPYPTPDWTWDDFVEKAKALTIKADNGRVSQYGYAADLGWPPMITTIYKNGGTVMNDDRTAFTLDQPESIDAIEKTRRLMYEDGVAPSPEGLQGLGVGNMDLFNSQKAAMISGGRWVAFFAQPLKANWGVVPFPAGKPGSPSPLLFVTLAAPKTTKYPEQAWKFIEFSISEEGQKIISSTGLGLPVRKSVLDEGGWLLGNEPKEHIGIYRGELEKAASLPFHPEWAKTIDEIMWRETDTVFRNKASAADAVAKMVTEANKVLAESK